MCDQMKCAGTVNRLLLYCCDRCEVECELGRKERVGLRSAKFKATKSAV